MTTPPSGFSQSEVVVHRLAEFLLAAQIALSCLNRCVPKQKLNLLKFSARQMAYACAGAAQVMGSKVLYISALRGRFHHVPDRLGRDATAPNLTQPTHSPEYHATTDAGRCSPLVDCALRSRWHRNGTDVLSFSNQVSDYPVLLAYLEIFRSESNQFSPSQAASNEQRQNRPITFTSEAV